MIKGVCHSMLEQDSDAIKIFRAEGEKRFSLIESEVTSLFRATQFVSLGATKGPDHERQTVYDGR